MTPSLPRAPQIGSRQVVEALRKLATEVGGLKAFEPGVREAIGNTNWRVLMQRLDEAEAALSRTAQAPVADGVREARRQAIEEVLGLLTGHELYRYRPKAFNGLSEMSDPCPNDHFAKEG